MRGRHGRATAAWAAVALLAVLWAAAAEGRATLEVALAHPQAEGLAHVRTWLAQALLPELRRPWRLLPQEERLGALAAGRGLAGGGLLVSAAPLAQVLLQRQGRAPPLAVLLLGSDCAADVGWYGRAAFVLRTHWCPGLEGLANVAWLPPPWRTPPAVRSFAAHRHRHLPHPLRAFDFTLVGRASREARQMERAATGAAAVGEVRLHAGLADPAKARAVQQPPAVYAALLQEARAVPAPGGEGRLCEALQHGAVPLALASASPLGAGLQGLGLAMRNVRRELAPLLDRIAGPDGPALARATQALWREEREAALARLRRLVDAMLGD